MFPIQSSAEAVDAALRFDPSGYIPIYDQFWGGFLNLWRQSRGLPLREGVPPERCAGRAARDQGEIGG